MFEMNGNMPGLAAKFLIQSLCRHPLQKFCGLLLSFQRLFKGRLYNSTGFQSEKCVEILSRITVLPGDRPEFYFRNKRLNLNPLRIFFKKINFVACVWLYGFYEEISYIHHVRDDVCGFNRNCSSRCNGSNQG
jgi:hypothetical protein